MDKDLLQKYFFVSLLLAIGAVAFFIFLPFMQVIVLSIIFSVALSPLHKRITKLLGGRRGISALIVILLFAIIVIVPFILLALQVLNESHNLYAQIISHSGSDYTQKLTDFIDKPVQRFYPEFSFNIGDIVGIGTDWLTGHLTGIVTSVISIVTKIMLIFFSLFFFLRDGSKFKKILIDLSPLHDTYDVQIFEKMRNTINATVRGVILVAIVQGLMAGIGLWIFHVPNYTLWGSISAVCSLIPGLGTAGVFIPAIIYMYATGHTPDAIGLILWSTLIVGFVDNFLTPYFYSRSVEIHQVIMLFAVLGGLSFFGPIGFIFGPIVISLFFTLIEIYQSLILKKHSL